MQRSPAATAALYTLALLVTLVSVFPFVYAITTSLKTGSELFSTSLWPENGSLANYISLFTVAEQPFGRHVVNSVVVSTLVVVLSLFVGVTAAYALGRISFKGRGLLLTTILGVSMFPQVAVLAGMFEMIRALGLYNRSLGLVLPYWWAGFALLAIGLFLTWLTAVSWPGISGASRALRVVVDVSVLGLAVLRLLGRF